MAVLTFKYNLDERERRDRWEDVWTVAEGIAVFTGHVFVRDSQPYNGNNTFFILQISVLEMGSPGVL